MENEGTNGVPYHGPHVMLDHSERDYLLQRLAHAEEHPVAASILYKCRVSAGAHPKLTQPLGEKKDVR